MIGRAALALAATFALSPAFAEPAAWFPIPDSAVFRTGDTWVVGGGTYRLYGVQSCLRGTTVTNAHGLERDCGEASLAILIALVRDLRPQCYGAARLPQDGTSLVFCVATRVTGAGAGSRLDLGTALIAMGYAFAALKPDATPVHPPYRVAEDLARRDRAGLWAFADLPNPNALILRALADRDGVPVPPDRRPRP